MSGRTPQVSSVYPPADSKRPRTAVNMARIDMSGPPQELLRRLGNFVPRHLQQFRPPGVRDLVGPEPPGRYPCRALVVPGLLRGRDDDLVINHVHLDAR